MSTSKKPRHFLVPNDSVEEDEFTRKLNYRIENKARDIVFDEPSAKKAVLPSESKLKMIGEYKAHEEKIIKDKKN